nr:unnamed protein product [Trichobilharzia regenti]
MTVEQRKCFEEMAKLDTERFNREMAHYVPPTGMRRGRRRRRIKDPGMPKRSWSAFFFFCDAFRSKIRSEHPDWKVSDIAKELGRRWEECTDKEKYERRAQNDKLRYEQDMQKYKAGLYVATKRARIDEQNTTELLPPSTHDHQMISQQALVVGETSQIIMSREESVTGVVSSGVEDDEEEEEDEEEDEEEEEGEEEEGDDEEHEDEEDDEEEDDNRDAEQSRGNPHGIHHLSHNKTSDGRQMVTNETNNNAIMNTGN